jgi:hypothetical protein
MPERIQRKRTRGWRMPENTVSVTRPGKFGNPFRIGGWFKLGARGAPMVWVEAYDGYQDQSFTKVKTREQAVEFYREYRRRFPLTLAETAKLKGKNLACFCPLDQPCHADVLLELANPPDSQPGGVR